MFRSARPLREPQGEEMTQDDILFDGDQLTAIAVKSAAYHAMFMTMCPTYAFIDRADGKFNRAMDFKKDYSGLISAAWDIDTAYDNYLRDPDEDSYDTLNRLGLDEVTSEESDKIRKKLFRDLIDGKIDGKFAERFG